MNYANQNQAQPRKYYFEVFDTTLAWSNLAGDPRKKRTKYPNESKECCIYIPAEATDRYGKSVIQSMLEAGVFVGTKEGEEGDQPKYYVYAEAYYGMYEPDIAIVNPDLSERPLHADTVSEIDSMHVTNVSCVLRTYVKQSGRVTLQIQRMRVEGNKRTDPWKEYWDRRRASMGTSET